MQLLVPTAERDPDGCFDAALPASCASFVFLTQSVCSVESPTGKGCALDVQALLDNGGATAVACGATFSLALTASGRVVVWGGIAGCKPPPESRRCAAVSSWPVQGLFISPDNNDLLGMSELHYTSRGSCRERLACQGTMLHLVQVCKTKSRK